MGGGSGEKLKINFRNITQNFRIFPSITQTKYGKKTRRSFGKKLNQSNKSLFIGREEQLKLFEDNLARGAEHDDFLDYWTFLGFAVST